MAVLATALVGGAVYWVSLPVSTGPAHATGVEGRIDRAQGNRRTLRIAAMNIHGGTGRDGRRDLGRVAECLAGFDFVALNEVHGPGLGQSQDQAEQLGRELGMAWLFAPAVRNWSCLEFGNGLLTALPVDCWQRIPLARRLDRSCRNAVLVGLQFQGRTVHVLLTHISRRYDEERQAQLRAVIALYLALAEPAILLGDLNSPCDDPQIRQLLAAPGVSDPLSEVLAAKGESLDESVPGRIDWIVARGFRTVDAGVQDSGASDHPLVWAELELAPGAGDAR